MADPKPPSSARPIVNIHDVTASTDDTRTKEHGDAFACSITPVSAHNGAQKLAYNITTVPPGKRAFPFHNHHVAEEMFLVLSGTGTLRFGDAEHPLREGDCVACPPGGADVAHQIINTGDVELRYFALATDEANDVFEYPDSHKFGVSVGRKPQSRFMESRLWGIWDQAATKDYWDGE